MVNTFIKHYYLLNIKFHSIIVDMAKEIRVKSDVEWNFYQSAEDVQDPRKVSSEKKHQMVLMICYLKNKTKRESY